LGPREQNDALAASQLKWREAQEEVLGLRAKLEDMQAQVVESAPLQRQLVEAERARARLETEVEWHMCRLVPLTSCRDMPLT
jgi:hypothetical protein